MKTKMQVLFYIASCLELAMGMIEMCNYEFPLKRIILWGFFLVYFMNMLCTEYTRTEKVVFAIVMVLGIILYINTGINTGIKAPVYIMALKGVDRKCLCKCFLFTLLGVTLAVGCRTFFINPDNLFFEDVRKSRGFGGLRFCVGFAHPNRLQVLIFGMLAYALLLYGNRLHIGQFVGVMFLYLFMSYMTNSRTGFLLGVFVGLAVIFARNVKWKSASNIVMFLFLVIIVFMLLISFLAAANVEKGFLLEKINTFISGRMNQLALYTSDSSYNLPYMENWALFSNRNNKNGYDMGYVFIFYYYGIIMGACYLAFVIGAVDKARRSMDLLGMVLIMGLSIYMFMETGYHSNYLTRDFLLMTSAVVLWGDYETQVQHQKK